MIEAVSTSVAAAGNLRAISQASAATPSSALSAGNPKFFVSSRIRVDNLLDVAILEFRTGEGEVVNQYPTNAQIQVMKRAAELESANHQVQRQASNAAPAPQQAAAPEPRSAPAPQAAAPAPAVGGGDASSSGGHSILV